MTWSLQPEETNLRIARKSTAPDHLQLPNLTQGPKIAQIGLGYGADDFGSTMIEENVVSAAGNKFILNSEELERLITDAGYTPRRRNTRYELLGSKM